MGMTVIFTPIYLYSTGLSVYGSMKQALFLVVGYYLLQRILIAVGVFPLSKIIERLGFRRSVALSLFFLILHTLSLILISKNIVWIWAAAVFIAIQTPLYWISRDSVISQDSLNPEMGRNMANLAVWEKIATIIGPFFGGLILSIYGFVAMYAVAVVFLVLSAIPLWWMHSHTHKNGVSVKGFFFFLRDKRFVHTAVSNFAMSIQDYSLSVIWPLILFFRGIHDKTLGGLFSLVAVASLLVEYGAGRFFDTLRKRRDWADESVYALSGVANSAIWMARMFARVIKQFLTIDLIGSFIITIFGSFFGDYMHIAGKRMGSIAFWVYEEVLYSLGTVFLFSLMALGVRYGIWMELIIVTAAWWSLVAIVAARESNLH